MFSKFERYFRENGSTIATVGSMVCTALALIFAIKSAEDGATAKELYEDEKKEIEEMAIADRKPDDELRNKATYAINLFHAYKKSIIFSGIAIGLSWKSHSLDMKKLAGLGAVVALNKEEIKKVYKKVDDIFGEGTSESIKEAINCDVPPFDPDNMHKAKVRKRMEKKEKQERYLDSETGETFWEYPSMFDKAVQRAQERYDSDGKYLLWNKWNSIRGLEDTKVGIVLEFTDETPFGVSIRTAEKDGVEWNLILYDHSPVVRTDVKFL